MKETASEPFRPCVTISEIENFDPDKPETYTKSPLINAVLRAVAALGPHSSKAICDYLQVSGTKLWPAVELLTGYGQFEFRMLIVDLRINRLEKEHPDWSTDMYAKALGYRSRSDLFRIFDKNFYDTTLSCKSKTARYYKNRKKGEE